MSTLLNVDGVATCHSFARPFAARYTAGPPPADEEGPLAAWTALNGAADDQVFEVSRPKRKDVCTLLKLQASC